jgi:carbon starvation protein
MGGKLEMIALIFLLGCVALAGGYAFYSRVIARWLDIDDARKTPAHVLTDGVDYVPSHTPVLFGHHFSSIAGAGPIVGPIMAAVWFGWLPAILWIVIGTIFIGGVHDYTSLVASIRHRGRSIGEICRRYLSPFTYRVFLAFVFFTLVYVLIVFLDLTAATFAPENLEAGAVQAGGAVATASVLYILIALIFGVAVQRLGVSFKIASLIFVPLVFAALVVGIHLPLTADLLPAVIYDHPKFTWAVILLVYCFIASITPVWLLLQPRDYLSSFLLFACLFGGGIGLLLASVTGQSSIAFPAFTGWWSNSEAHTGFIFPLLFITVACGAVSGFHSIVASGTSAKQLNREGAARTIAYGGMVVEGVLALIAVAAVMVLARNDARLVKPSAPALFAEGMGRFFGAFGLKPEVGLNLGLLAVSTFLLTTLDTATRLSRFIFEEFFGLSDRRWRYLSTAATLVLPTVIVFTRIPVRGQPGQYLAAWKAVWPVFGTTNQLLAALALLVVFVWLASQGKRKMFVLIPMLFMLVTTLTSLGGLVQVHLLKPGGQKLIGGICLMLLVLAVLVVCDTILKWRRITSAAAVDAAG